MKENIMNSTYRTYMLIGIIGLFFASCNDEYGPRKESFPVFETVALSPTTFTFGDSIALSAKLSDPATMLTTLKYEILSENRVITSGEIPLMGDTYEVNQSIFVPLLNNQIDNSEIVINLVATNILKGAASYEITDLTGKRPVYNKLYLVTDEGTVAELLPLPSDKEKFEGTDLTLDPKLRFKIAEKLNADKTIDYSGAVYGNVDGKIAMIDKTGESSFIYTPAADYTKVFSYDNYAFSAATAGSYLGDNDLALSTFGDQDIYGESFRTLKRTLEKGITYAVFGILADVENIYNPDFFERTDDSHVKFLGETGEYTIYYNPVRKNIIVGVDNPAYPQYLLACGYGLGYPTNVTSNEIGDVYSGHHRVHTDWGFGHIMNYVLLRQISDGVYQGTFFTPGDHDHYAGFKPFENTGWGNEKKAGNFTFTGEQIISGDNNWTIANGDNDPVIESANYRFTIDLKNNKVNIEKVTLY